jgi:hypothetical protein
MNKQNIEPLTKNNNLAEKGGKYKSSFYPVYVGQLKIESQTESHIEY